MRSRDRVLLVLDHQVPDRVPLDLGASVVTGMHASSVYLLRQALRLDPPGTPVKIVEPGQMLGEIQMDLADVLGVDVVGIPPFQTVFGYPLCNWKPWTLWDSTPVLVPEGFNTQPEPDGRILMYPQGDRSVPPSGVMPAGGYYFDNIIRQTTIDEDHLNLEDNLEEFTPVSAAELAYLSQQVDRLYQETDKAIIAMMPGTDFGDISAVPVPWLKHPKGVRDVATWYALLASHKDFVYQLFERQCAIALGNLEKVYQAVGDRISIAYMSGADFGAQTGLLISRRTYRDLFKSFHKQLNDWVHQHTRWKTFIHCCGSIQDLIPELIEAGFDVLNPVQTSAAGMDPATLKDRFGDQIVFWGGGVDTQSTLPFGTSEEIRAQVKERMDILGKNGGFVFTPIHNVQANIPVENILALYQAVQDFRAYPPV